MNFRIVLVALLFAGSLNGLTAAEKAKVVFISGTPSHGRMHHEHRAGNMILAKALNDSGLDIEAKLVPHYGYPKDTTILQDADTVLCVAACIAVQDTRMDEATSPA